MSNTDLNAKVQLLKRGNRNTMPAQGGQGEPRYAIDTREFFINDGNGNNLLIGSVNNIKFKEAYRSTVKYDKFDIVEFEKTLYISLVDNNINELPGDSQDWKLFGSGTTEFITDDNTYETITPSGDTQKDINKAIDQKIKELTRPSRNRGYVWTNAENRFGFTVTAVSVVEGGDGFEAGQIVYPKFPTVEKYITPQFRIVSVTELGSIIELEIVNGGEFDDADDPTGEYFISAASGYQDAKIEITDRQIKNLSNLTSVNKPVMGDEVDVLYDETNSGEEYRYIYSDVNGDGVVRWIPLYKVYKRYSIENTGVIPDATVNNDGLMTRHQVIKVNDMEETLEVINEMVMKDTPNTRVYYVNGSDGNNENTGRSAKDAFLTLSQLILAKGGETDVKVYLQNTDQINLVDIPDGWTIASDLMTREGSRVSVGSINRANNTEKSFTLGLIATGSVTDESEADSVYRYMTFESSVSLSGGFKQLELSDFRDNLRIDSGIVEINNSSFDSGSSVVVSGGTVYLNNNRNMNLTMTGGIVYVNGSEIFKPSAVGQPAINVSGGTFIAFDGAAMEDNGTLAKIMIGPETTYSIDNLTFDFENSTISTEAQRIVQGKRSSQIIDNGTYEHIRANNDIITQEDFNRAVDFAIGSIMTSGDSSDRGAVVNAYQSTSMKSITSATSAVEGSGYTIGDLIFVETDFSKQVEKAVLVVTSVGPNGGIINLRVVKEGAYTQLENGTYDTTTSDSGTGARILIVTTLKPTSNLLTIMNPRVGDTVRVLRDETNGNTKYKYIYSMYEGSNGSWVPLEADTSTSYIADDVTIEINNNIIKVKNNVFAKKNESVSTTNPTDINTTLTYNIEPVLSSSIPKNTEAKNNGTLFATEAQVKLVDNKVTGIQTATNTVASNLATEISTRISEIARVDLNLQSETSSRTSEIARVEGIINQNKNNTDNTLSEKVDAIVGTSTYDKAYIKKAGNTQSSVDITETEVSLTLALRDAAGRIRANEPLNQKDLVNLKYLMDNYQTAVDAQTNLNNEVQRATLAEGTLTTNLNTLNNRVSGIKVQTSTTKGVLEFTDSTGTIKTVNAALNGDNIYITQDQENNLTLTSSLITRILQLEALLEELTSPENDETVYWDN